MPDLGKEALPPMSMCLSHLAPNQAFRPLWSMGRALQLQHVVSAPPLTPSCSTYRCKEALSKQAVSPDLLNQGFSGQTDAVPHKTRVPPAGTAKQNPRLWRSTCPAAAEVQEGGGWTHVGLALAASSWNT